MEDEKKRAPNFTQSEKELLVTVVSQYKSIIEGKKRDGPSWRVKEDTWGKVERAFNAQNVVAIHRSKEVLKKCYENMKHNVKIDAASEKKYVRCTGGGPPYKKPREGSEGIKDALLDIMNKKTVYGLSNTYDDDHTYSSNNPAENYSEDVTILDKSEDATDSVSTYLYCLDRLS